MILELWLALLGLSLALMYVGFSLDERVILFVGLFFFFLLGTIILTNQLEVETGLVIVENATATNVTYSYTSFGGDFAQWFGFFLSVLAGAGMWLVFVDWKRLQS